jgi:hypothetical protein
MKMRSRPTLVSKTIPKLSKLEREKHMEIACALALEPFSKGVFSLKIYQIILHIAMQIFLH